MFVHHFVKGIIKKNYSSAINKTSFDSSEGNTVPNYSELPEEEKIIQSVLQKLAYEVWPSNRRHDTQLQVSWT